MPPSNATQAYALASVVQFFDFRQQSIHHAGKVSFDIISNVDDGLIAGNGWNGGLVLEQEQGADFSLDE